jgi:mitochondrial fission protein ELM1
LRASSTSEPGAVPAAAPRIWVLLGDKQGDNNQLLALAEQLGLPFETRSLRYRELEGARPPADQPDLGLLTDECRAELAPPWPDLVIGIGWRSVPVALHIREANEGRTRLVRVGNPRCDPGLFDLVLTTRQYPVPDGPAVRWLPLAMSRYQHAPPVEADESAFLDRLRRPHLLLVVGGDAKHWRLPPLTVFGAAFRLANRARRLRGSLVVVTRRRTSRKVRRALRLVSLLRRNIRLVADRPRFAVLLADADECFVTADSASMISEAVLTGKPVGLIRVELTSHGRKKLTEDPTSDTALRRRDLRRFWAHLLECRLAGTIDRPVSASIENPALEAAAEVRALLN